MQNNPDNHSPYTAPLSIKLGLDRIARYIQVKRVQD